MHEHMDAATSVTYGGFHYCPFKEAERTTNVIRDASG